METMKRKTTSSIILENKIDQIVRETVKELTESKDIKKKSNGKWGVKSGKTGKMWKANYKSKKDAQAGLRAYFANKS